MIERKYISLVTFLLLSVFPVSFSVPCSLCGPDGYMWETKPISSAWNAQTCVRMYWDDMSNLQAGSSTCNWYRSMYQETCCNSNPCRLCGPDEALQWYRYVTSDLDCAYVSYDMRRLTAESDECISDKSSYQEICCDTVTPSPRPTPWPTPTPTPGPTIPRVFKRRDRPFIYIFFGVLAGVVSISFCVKFYRQQSFETAQTQQERPTGHQQATPSAPPEATVNTDRTARQELFLEKFLFQTVLSDKSNIYAASIRSLDAERGNNDHTLSKKEEEEESNDDDDDPKLTPDEGKISSWRRMLSSWRKPAKDDECCICLENYEPGQLICAAVTDKCNHAFHAGCMKNWIEDNDTCPICRTNFVES